MGLPFKLPLSANTQFVRVGDIPELTASAIYPVPGDEQEGLTGDELDATVQNHFCHPDHVSALDEAIDAGTVTPLNSLSYKAHTSPPSGDARKNAVITIDDFKRFAASLQIEVVILDEPVPTQLEKQGVEYRLDSPPIGINRNEVMAAFTVKQNPDENRKFWDDKLSRPPKWLKDARTNPGKPGTSALWDPLLTAHSLLAEGHMTLVKLDGVMNKCFPELVESWNETTSDKR